MIWGVKQQGSIFFDPAKVQWFYHQYEYTSRIGSLQIWMTGLLFKFFGLNPYIFHLNTFILKTIAATVLLIVVWKLTDKISLALLSGFLFVITSVGAESIWWYNVSAVYLFISLVLVSLIFFIRGVGANNKAFIISLILITLSVYLYPPRAHIFLGFPVVGLIYGANLKSKSLWGKVIITGLLIVFSFVFLLGSQGTDIANSHFGRMIGGLREGFKREQMLLTYPVDVIAISAFSQNVLSHLANFPDSLTNINNRFYFLVLIFFPAVWFGISKLLSIYIGKLAVLKRRLIFFSGFIWIIINLLLKSEFFSIKWNLELHISFIVSGLMILLAIFMFLFLRDSLISSVAKLISASVVLIFSGYLVNWFSDPMQLPTFNDNSRYFTVSSAFGAIFLACFIYFLIISINKLLKSNRYKNILMLATLVSLLLFIKWFININISSAIYSTNSFLDIKSHQIMTHALNTIKESLKTKDNYPPPFVIVQTEDSIESNGFIPQSYALWANINDQKLFPFFYGESDQYQVDYQKYCQEFKEGKPSIYKFRVTKKETVDITSSLKEISCQN